MDSAYVKMRVLNDELDYLNSDMVTTKMTPRQRKGTFSEGNIFKSVITSGQVCKEL